MSGLPNYPGPPGSIINSANLAAILTAAWPATPWTQNLGTMGNGGTPATWDATEFGGHGDCVSAQEAHAKQILSTATGGTYVCLLEGAQYSNGGPVSPWPQAGVVPWAAKNGVLEGAHSTQVMDMMGVEGMYTGTSGAYVQHKDGANPSGASYPYYAGIDWTNQKEVWLALAYFKTINLCINSAGLSGLYSHFSSGVVTPGGDHEVCACDCGTAAQLCRGLRHQRAGRHRPHHVLRGHHLLGQHHLLHLGLLPGHGQRGLGADHRSGPGGRITFNPVAEADYLGNDESAPSGNTVINSTAAIAANGGCTSAAIGDGNYGGITYNDCAVGGCSAWHKALVTSATGAAMLFLARRRKPVYKRQPNGEPHARPPDRPTWYRPTRPA